MMSAIVENSARGTNVSIEKSAVVKRFPPGQLQDEADKAVRFHASAEGCFIAPRLLDIDEVQSTLRLELVDCGENLQARLGRRGVSPDDHADLFRRIGKVLARIHRAPTVASDPELLRSDEFNSALADRETTQAIREGLVFQHGDFGFSNLFVVDDEVVVIDASPNNYASVHPLSLDVREFDAVMILTNLTGRTTVPGVLARLIRHGNQWRSALLAGYEVEAGSALRSELLLPLADAHLHAFRTTYSIPRRVLLKPASVRLGRAAERVSQRSIPSTPNEMRFP